MVKNNLLFFLGNFSAMGDLAGNAAAVLGVCDQFDLIVGKLPVIAADLRFLKSTIAGYCISKPAGQFFGWTSLGTSLDVLSWEAAVDAWQAAFGTALAGIFIDDFGFENVLCTRANQNAAVAYCHGKGLATFVRATNVVDTFDLVSSPVPSLLGRLPAITDYVLLSNFHQLNQNSVTPAAETPASVVGRLQFTQHVRTDVSVVPNIPLALRFAVLVGAGLQNEVDLRNVWLPSANAAEAYGVEYLGVAPFDESAVSNKFFIRNAANYYTYGTSC